MQVATVLAVVAIPFRSGLTFRRPARALDRGNVGGRNPLSFGSHLPTRRTWHHLLRGLEVAIPFRSGLTFRHGGEHQDTGARPAVAIPFRSGLTFRHRETRPCRTAGLWSQSPFVRVSPSDRGAEVFRLFGTTWSQSPFVRVSPSDAGGRGRDGAHLEVAIPFRSGLTFRLGRIRTVTRRPVAIPFRSGLTFRRG